VAEHVVIIGTLLFFCWPEVMHLRFRAESVRLVELIRMLVDLAGHKTINFFISDGGCRASYSNWDFVRSIPAEH